MIEYILIGVRKNKNKTCLYITYCLSLFSVLRFFEKQESCILRGAMVKYE